MQENAERNDVIQCNDPFSFALLIVCLYSFLPQRELSFQIAFTYYYY